jgi:hypothetical protein
VVMAAIATAFASHQQVAPAAGRSGPPPGGIPAAFVTDTPPRPPTVPVAAEGWPFQQLPMVAKFGVPERERARLTPMRSPFISIRTPRFPETPREPVPAAPSPLWLLTPLAFGVAFADVEGPGSVVPEPSSVILLATGVALLGLKVRLRRPRDRRPG